VDLSLAALPSAEPVRLIATRGGLGAVPGLKLAGVHSGIKKRKSDLALIALGGPHVCAQVITTNDIKAAPLMVSGSHLDFDGDSIAAIVVNAGCANACTGERGLRDARATARQAATLLKVRPSHRPASSASICRWIASRRASNERLKSYPKGMKRRTMRPKRS
jgi:N-acetylglutamate synthase/N-acetylornithine aminotransferase